MKVSKISKSPNIEWERMEYTLKNGATVEIIREKVIEDDYADEEDLLRDIL
ncbi:hypothetical protein GF345_02765 [Candidatus Woesearchaeota archaeon]|nr:hypothetical protein [Candidatus Woesearchaeota archaeon]